MSQRKRRQHRRWDERPDLYMAYMRRVIDKDDRLESGYLWWHSEYCMLPYQEVYHRKLIHNGRKP
jgi:hypothetical protein